MEKHKKGLTPGKVIFIYFLAFSLVFLHEIDRIVGWVEDICLDWSSASEVLDYCRRVRIAAREVGLDKAIDEENLIVARIRNFPELLVADQKMQEKPAPGVVQAEEPPLAPKVEETTVADEPVIALEPVERPAGKPAAAPPESPETVQAMVASQAGPGAGVEPLPAPDPALSPEPVVVSGTSPPHDQEPAVKPETPVERPVAPVAEPPSEPEDPASQAESSPEPDITADAQPLSNGEKINRLTRPVTMPAPTPAAASPEKETAEPEAPPASAPQKPVKKKVGTVLIAGDSMILEGFGPALERELSKIEGLHVVRDGKYSSGLSRPDYFDWPTHLEEILNKYKPDMLVLSLGANDAQDILDENRKRHFVGTDGWNSIYSARAENMLNLALEQHVLTFWVGLPIMGLKSYSPKIEVINSLVEEVCGAHENCIFVDTWQVLADDNGSYSTYLKNQEGRHIRVRAKDKIHLTSDGGRLMVEYFMKEAAAEVEFIDPEHAGDSEPEKGKSASPPDEARYGRNGAGVENNSAAPAEKVKTESGEQQSKTSPPKADLRLGTLFSEARGKSTQYYAYIPQAVSGGPDKFPVLYLLHGAWDDYRAWKERDGDVLAEMAGRLGLIIVLPDGDPFGWYADSPFDSRNQIETYIIDELIPQVESSAPVLSGKRGIAGLSMGGHGAFVLALRNPGKFISVSSMSGVLDITRHTRQWELPRVFGQYDGENIELWEDHSALLLSRRRGDVLKDMSLMVAVSSGDKWTIEENRLFKQELERQGLGFEYVEKPGDHDWKFWKSQLPAHLVFHAKALYGNGSK